MKHCEYITFTHLSPVPAMWLGNLCSPTIHAMLPLPFDFKSVKGQIMSSFVIWDLKSQAQGDSTKHEIDALTHTQVCQE